MVNGSATYRSPKECAMTNEIQFLQRFFLLPNPPVKKMYLNKVNKEARRTETEN